MDVISVQRREALEFFEETPSGENFIKRRPPKPKDSQAIPTNILYNNYFYIYYIIFYTPKLQPYTF